MRANESYLDYLVYSYQYNDMPRPKRRAIPYYGRNTLECLPPTVIEMHHVLAASAKDALQTAKNLFNR